MEVTAWKAAPLIEFACIIQTALTNQAFRTRNSIHIQTSYEKKEYCTLLFDHIYFLHSEANIRRTT